MKYKGLSSTDGAVGAETLSEDDVGIPASLSVCDEKVRGFLFLERLGKSRSFDPTLCLLVYCTAVLGRIQAFVT